MNLNDYPPEEVGGARLCIAEPENAYDQALKNIYDLYRLFFEKGIEPPVPTVLLKRFREQAESDQDYAEGVEIAICLAWESTHSDEPSRAQVAFQVIRVLATVARFIR